MDKSDYLEQAADIDQLDEKILKLITKMHVFRFLKLPGNAVFQERQFTSEYNAYLILVF
jgi:hypothetical protein